MFVSPFIKLIFFVYINVLALFREFVEQFFPFSCLSRMRVELRSTDVVWRCCRNAKQGRGQCAWTGVGAAEGKDYSIV